ncbi:glycosyltransferase family 4 protein [Hufsiella ginkgonis]|uniref:Glycosyltransferase n=1 Tax=Hufsiella ginkgonis TaxID=2695274 RepID=A0A7K1Y2U4_9SPHI|nr:glycosyltransferase family 4 protein [Hufsiella ginkgonis]MXV17408.1 glycosyltransferase [Hufsiella ginkgonis]
MRVVLLNNDFRVYWKGRLGYFHQFLTSKGIDLHAIELFGKGSPYQFDTYNNKESWWTCLFPENSSDELSKKNIERTLFGALDNADPDVIIAPSIVFFAGALGLRWAKKNKKKFIMFDDAKPSHLKRNMIVQWVKDMITSAVDGLWLPSKDYDAEYSSLYKHDIYFFHGYNCVDNDLFKNLGVNSLDHKRVICVARIVPIKNLRNLLRAWKQVEQSDQQYELNIVGDGPQLGSLQQLAQKLKLKRVVFTGAVDNHNLPGYFHRSDAFILPSLSESWGLVVNEAMAAGLPVLLSSRINAGKYLLHEDINGFGFDPTATREISAAILKYIRLKADKKREMADNSLSIINTMSYQHMGNELVKALHNIAVKRYKKPGFLSSILVNLWRGRYNTAFWDKL